MCFIFVMMNSAPNMALVHYPQYINDHKSIHLESAEDGGKTYWHRDWAVLYRNRDLPYLKFIEVSIAEQREAMPW